MLKGLTTCVIASCFLYLTSSFAGAVGYCPSKPGGKCPPKAQANGKSRDEFTPAQRKQIMEEARQLCIRTYGASSSVYRYEWKKRKVICYTAGQ